MNTLKTAVLMAALTVLLILVGSALGGSGGATLAFVVALAINGFSYWFSDKLVLRMSGAPPAPEADEPDLSGRGSRPPLPGRSRTRGRSPNGRCCSGGAIGRTRPAACSRGC